MLLLSYVKNNMAARWCLAGLLAALVLLVLSLIARPALLLMSEHIFFEKPIAHYSIPLSAQSLTLPVLNGSNQQVLSLRFKLLQIEHASTLFFSDDFKLSVVPYNQGGVKLTLTGHEQAGSPLKTVMLPQWLDAEELHDLHLTIWQSHVLKIKVDGELTQLANVNFRVGAGPLNFDKTQNSIQGASLAVTQYDAHYLAYHTDVATLFTLATGALFLIVILLSWRLMHGVLSAYEKVSLLSMIVLSGFLVSIALDFMVHCLYGMENSSAQFLPKVFFWGDFFDVYYSAQALNPYFMLNSGAIYLPFTYSLYFLLAKIPPTVAVTCFFASFLASMVYFNNKFFIKMPQTTSTKPLGFLHLMILTLMTYPLLFCLVRGNLDAFIFVLVAGALLLYRKQQFWGSALVLGLAIAMKGYPLIFCLLFAADKRYKEIVACGLLAFCLTLFSLLLFKHSLLFNIGHLCGNLQAFHHVFFLSGESRLFVTSFFGVAKTLLDIAVGSGQAHYFVLLDSLVQYYNRVVLVAGLLIGLYVLFIEKIWWRKLAVLVGGLLLLPPISFDYRLMFIYLPLYYFVNDESQAGREYDLRYVWLLGLLLIPKHYFFIYETVSVSNGLNVLLLCLLTGSIMFSGVKASFGRSRKITV